MRPQPGVAREAPQRAPRHDRASARRWCGASLLQLVRPARAITGVQAGQPQAHIGVARYSGRAAPSCKDAHCYEARACVGHGHVSARCVTKRSGVCVNCEL